MSVLILAPWLSPWRHERSYLLLSGARVKEVGNITIIGISANVTIVDIVAVTIISIFDNVTVIGIFANATIVDIVSFIFLLSLIFGIFC